MIMSDTKSWMLTDVESRVWLDRFELTAADAGLDAATPWSIRKQSLHGGLTEGVDIVEVNNGALSFTVVPTRGMGVWRGEYDGRPVGWDAPIRGPVNGAFVNPLERGGLGWLEGFDECIVRCGLESNGPPGKDVVLDNNGNPAEVDLTLHGRIANLPANKVEVQVTPGDPPELAVVGVVDEAMLFFPQLRLVTRIATKAGSNALVIEDEVINMKGVDAELELLYHCNFGRPFLDQGARLVAPVREVAPRDGRAAEDVETYTAYAAPTPGYVEQVYWHELNAAHGGDTLAMLRNAAGDKAVVLRFNTKQLPCFTQWKNTAAEADGYVTGLEPGTNYPNAKVFEREQGRVVSLPPGGSYRVRLVMEVHTDAAAVSAVEGEIAALQNGAAPVVHSQPIPRLSQVG